MEQNYCNLMKKPYGLGKLKIYSKEMSYTNAQNNCSKLCTTISTFLACQVHIVFNKVTFDISISQRLYIEFIKLKYVSEQPCSPTAKQNSSCFIRK